MRVRVSAQILLLERSWHRSQGKGGSMRVRVSAQFLLLERSWHRSQGKGGPNEVPRTPAPGPITFRLRLDWIYPAREDADGVGFEPTVGLPLLLISSQVH